MVANGKKPRSKWDSEVERKLINIWADSLKEFDGELINRKKKKAIATTCLNVCVSQELSRDDQYTEKDVYNKIYTIIKRERPCMLITKERGDRQGVHTR